MSWEGAVMFETSELKTLQWLTISSPCDNFTKIRPSHTHMSDIPILLPAVPLWVKMNLS